MITNAEVTQLFKLLDSISNSLERIALILEEEAS